MKKNKEEIAPVIIPYDYISNSDCIEGMKAMPSNCVDIIIADPPYNLSKSGDWKWDNSVSLSGMGGNWNITNENWDNMSLEDYFNFSIAWLTEAKRILKPTGSMWIFGTYHNIGIINIVCQMLGIEIINEVIWYKKNAFPNLSGRRLTASHETILWAHSGGKKRNYYFDYEYSKNGEFVGDELKSPGKQMRTVWDLSNNKKPEELKYGKHPTQKPIKVLSRMIKLSSRPGDIMLTPFAGAGSECVAAKMTGRHYIGFETEEEYCKISEDRLAHTEQENEQMNLFQIKQEETGNDETCN
jgi:DNA modification methylase